MAVESAKKELKEMAKLHDNLHNSIKTLANCTRYSGIFKLSGHAVAGARARERSWRSFDSTGI